MSCGPVTAFVSGSPTSTLNWLHFNSLVSLGTTLVKSPATMIILPREGKQLLLCLPRLGSGQGDPWIHAGCTWMHMLEQGNGPGPFKVTPMSAVEEIEELPLSLVGILVTPTLQGRRGAWNNLSQAPYQSSTFPTFPRDRLGHALGRDVGLTHSHYPFPGHAAHPQILLTLRVTSPSHLSCPLFLKSLYPSIPTVQSQEPSHDICEVPRSQPKAINTPYRCMTNLQWLFLVYVIYLKHLKVGLFLFQYLFWDSEISQTMCIYQSLLLPVLSKRFNFLLWNFLLLHFYSDILHVLLEVSLERIQLSNSTRLKQFENILFITVLSNIFHVSVLLIWVWTIFPLLE